MLNINKGRKEAGIIVFIIILIISSIIYTRSTVHAERPPPGSLIWTTTSNPSGAGDLPYGVTVDRSGVYIVGFDDGNPKWKMERRSITDGSLIWAQPSNPGMVDIAKAVAVDGSGVYIVGHDMIGLRNTRWRMEKRSITDGSLIWLQISDPSPIAMDSANGVTVDNTGVYIVGYDSALGFRDARWRIEKRSLGDGDLIWAETSNPSSSWDVPFDVAVDVTGVYIVGWEKMEETGDMRWRIEKRSTDDGSLIWAIPSNPSGYRGAAYSVAVDGTAVYIVGEDSEAGYPRWRMEKRSPSDGSLIWLQISDPSPYAMDSANGVTVDNTGVYIVGYDSTLGFRDARWRIEKRSLSDGGLIWAETSNPSSSWDVPFDVAVDVTGVYIVGKDKMERSDGWRIEKRYH